MSVIATDKHAVPVAIKRMKLVDEGLADAWGNLNIPGPHQAPIQDYINIANAVEGVKHDLTRVKDSNWETVMTLARTHAQILSASGELSESDLRDLEAALGSGPAQLEQQGLAAELFRSYRDGIGQIKKGIDSAVTWGEDVAFDGMIGLFAGSGALGTWAASGFRGDFRKHFSAQRKELLATPGVGLLRWATGMPARLAGGVVSTAADLVGLPGEFAARYSATPGRSFVSKLAGATTGTVIDFGLNKVVGKVKKAVVGKVTGRPADHKSSDGARPSEAIAGDALDEIPVVSDLSRGYDEFAEDYSKAGGDFVAALFDDPTGSEGVMAEYEQRQREGQYGEIIRVGSCGVDLVAQPLAGGGAADPGPVMQCIQEGQPAGGRGGGGGGW